MRERGEKVNHGKEWDREVWVNKDWVGVGKCHEHQSTLLHIASTASPPVGQPNPEGCVTCSGKHYQGSSRKKTNCLNQLIDD